MANLGPIQVPDKLAPVLPYVKAVVAALGVIATVLSVVLGAGTPAFVYVIISAATLLGVYVVPNGQVKAILQDGLTAVEDVDQAYQDAKKADVADAGADLKKAELAANGALGGAEAIIKGVDPALAPLPPLPVKPGKDEPPHPPASGVLT